MAVGAYQVDCWCWYFGLYGIYSLYAVRLFPELALNIFLWAVPLTIGISLIIYHRQSQRSLWNSALKFLPIRNAIVRTQQTALNLGRLPKALDIARALKWAGWRVIIAELFACICVVHRVMWTNATKRQPNEDKSTYGSIASHYAENKDDCARL